MRVMSWADTGGRLPIVAAMLLLLFSARGTSQPHTNHLIRETSPYLLLHAHNPVDWYPWGGEAMEKARKEQKPIFLSIGYYTCHWCHVMEQESYSSPEVAAVLNRYFVAIKVDREERPDVDRLYIAYLEDATGNAGWPANIFLTPDLKPFDGGIYFTAAQLKKLLLKIAEDWSKDREHVTQRAGRAAQVLAHLASEPGGATGPMSAASLDKAFRRIASTYDGANGGFGAAPKFPRPVALELLLRTYARTSQHHALEMVTATLTAMARGGIHDQLGGGFHRYSTDAKWLVPHFEKMLYDQAQISTIFVEAFQITKDPFFAAAARDVLDFSLREMELPGGGFGSALDADSAVVSGKPETAEGAYYVWTADEIERTLGKESAALFGYRYGVEPRGNVPISQNRRGELDHQNVLYQRHDEQETAQHFGLPVNQIFERITAAHRLLLQVRSRRPRPGIDDKVVTAWNGMMVLALARTSQALEEPRYRTAAESAAQYLESHLYDARTQRLRRSYRAGAPAGKAVLDDYTDLIGGLIELYQSGFDVHWLQWAVKLQEEQDELFWDSERAGYFDAQASDTALLARTREQYDGAEPSPNATAAMNLLRLAEITGRDSWRTKARQTINAFGARLVSQPEDVPALASALDFDLAPIRHIVIAGDPLSRDTHELLHLVNERFLPNVVLLLADGGPGQEQLARWLPFLAGAHQINGKATAYICDNLVCKLPSADPKVVARLLDAGPPITPGSR